MMDGWSLSSRVKSQPSSLPEGHLCRMALVGCLALQVRYAEQRGGTPQSTVHALGLSLGGRGGPVAQHPSRVVADVLRGREHADRDRCRMRTVTEV